MYMCTGTMFLQIPAYRFALYFRKLRDLFVTLRLYFQYHLTSYHTVVDAVMLHCTFPFDIADEQQQRPWMWTPSKPLLVAAICNFQDVLPVLVVIE